MKEIVDFINKIGDVIHVKEGNGFETYYFLPQIYKKDLNDEIKLVYFEELPESVKDVYLREIRINVE